MEKMKQRMAQVVAAGIAMVSVIAASGIPAYATENTYTSDGTATVPITATVSSSYTVVLPSTTQALTDDDNDGSYTATVRFDVYGKINSDKAVVVSAGAENKISTYTKEYLVSDPESPSGYVGNTFTMTGTESGDTVTGSTIQSKVRFLSSTATPETAFDVAVSRSKAATAPYQVQLGIPIHVTDTYTGALSFHFGLQDK